MKNLCFRTKKTKAFLLKSQSYFSQAQHSIFNLKVKTPFYFSKVFSKFTANMQFENCVGCLLFVRMRRSFLLTESFSLRSYFWNIQCIQGTKLNCEFLVLEHWSERDDWVEHPKQVWSKNCSLPTGLDPYVVKIKGVSLTPNFVTEKENFFVGKLG